MRTVTGALLAISLMSMPLSLPAWAAKRDAPPAEAQQAPVPAEPQQTSASFGDWVVRCERAGAKRVCEVAQSLIIKGQQAPIAQVAFGRGADAEGSLFLTTLLPVNVAFDKPPSLAPQGKNAEAKDAQGVTLAWRRCLPGGCLADVKLDMGFVRALRSAPQGRLAFTDAAERTIALPLSFRGLAQALDDLDKER